VGDTFVEKIILLFLSAGVTSVVSLFIPILRENQLFTWLYFIAVGLTIFLPDYLYRGIERMECVTIPFTVSKIVSIILTLVLIKNDSDLILIPVFEIVSNLIAVIISLSLLKKLNVAVKITGFKKWVTDLKESAVYFLSNFATTVFGALTTLIVGVLLNERDVAYWSVCMQIVSAAKAMYTPIANSIYPHMVTNKDLKLVRKIRNLMTVPMVIGTIAVMLFGENIMVIIGGENYHYAGTILKFLLPVIVVSFYSMLYGWPVLGAINRVKQTTVSTVIAAAIQIIGILLIYVLNSFNLISLALCCCVSEIALLIIRLMIFKRNRKLFSN
jgi:PST family polysaccharide transporter